MKKDNLVKRLGKKFLPYVLAGSLSLGTLFNYKCAVSESNDTQKPVAVLSAQPTEGDAPLYVNFDGSKSYAPEGYLEQYLWEFGDGKTDTTTHAFTNYLYENGGEYNAGLVVVDNKGQKSNKALEKIVVNDDIVSLGQIAFWSNRPVPGGYNEDIYSGEIIVKNNNTELRNIKRLTTNPGQDLEPTWSPDGNEILFTSHRTGGTAVWRMDANGDNQRDITSDIVERARQANWGSDGKIVVAYRDNGDSEVGIGIIDPNENSFTPIYSEPNVGSVPGWPSCSPDASEVAFARYVNRNWEVYKINSNGNNLTNLTNHPAIDGSPDWSPDGNYILFKSYRFGSADLHLMDKNGAYIGRLTNDSGIETEPQFSADGSKIIFTHDIDMSNPQIYIMNADGTGNWTQLTTEGANRYPALKPRRDN